jgi:acetyl-CoA carboxylase carboxyltransferase component
VIEAATGQEVGREELGGARVGASVSGQVDVVAETVADGIRITQDLLGYLPDHRGALPPVAAEAEPELQGSLEAVVPANRRRAYDMRRILRHLFDAGSVRLVGELRSRPVLTAFARLGGRPVGVVANQPMQMAGAFGARGCDSIARFLTLCDSFNVPLVFLQDTPGLMVGPAEEHDRLLFRAMLLQQALVNTTVPKITVVLRKAYGLAHHLMAGCGMGADYLCAWPGAEFGFMDPDVAASVLHGRALAALDDEARGPAREAYAAELTRDTDVWGPAGVMRIDEVIAPDETREVLLRQVDRLTRSRSAHDYEHRLATWPTCW